MSKPAVVAAPICFLILATLLLTFSSNALASPKSAIDLAALLTKNGKAAVVAFSFQLSTFDTREEVAKIRDEVKALDGKCTDGVLTGVTLAEDLASSTEGHPIMKRLAELYESRELMMIISNHIKPGSPCKLKRFKIYFLGGAGLMVDVRRKSR